jgi:hypothetical protein
MRRQGLPTDKHFVYWLAAALLIMSVSLANAALIAVVASMITVVQLIVIALTVALIDGGVLITVWQMSGVNERLVATPGSK